MSAESDRAAFADSGPVAHLVREMEAGGMTREQFITRAVGLGVSATVIGSLLGGGAASASAATRGARVKAKSTLSVADVGGGTADTLDPHKQYTSLDGIRITALYDKLLRFNENWEPLPHLAEEVEGSKDVKTWTIRLVDGATFHDGSPVTAEDVKFTFEQLLDPKVAASAGDNYTFMKGAQVKILDSRTIRYTLKQPYADVPAALADVGGCNVIPHTFNAATANTAPNGSGPWQFESFTPGQQSVMKKNPNYWMSGYPIADELTVSDIVDDSARINAVLAGTIDLAINQTAAVIKTVQTGGGKAIIIPGNGLSVLCVVPDVAPYTWKDPRVREALALSIDRKQVVDVVFGGHASIGNDQPIGPTYQDHPVGIPVRPHDPERAKHLLKEAGHPHGISTTLYTSEQNPGMNELATVAAEQAAAAGINIKIKVWSPDTYTNDIFLKKEFYVDGWTHRGCAQLFLATTVYTNSIYNESHFRSKQVDKWLTEAEETQVTAERVHLYSEALGKVAASAQWIIPSYSSIIHCGVAGFEWETLPPGTAGPYMYNAYVKA